MLATRRLLVTLLLGTSACAGRTAPAEAPAAGAESSPTVASGAPWGLPPAEADLASRRVQGSRIATVQTSPDAPSCPSASTPPKADQALAALTARCAKGHTRSAGPFTGDIGDTGAARAHSFTAEPSACYRIYLGADPSVQALATVVQDAEGGLVVDSPDDVVPSAGYVCNTSSTNATLTLKIAAGLGKGRYALEVWKR